MIFKFVGKTKITLFQNSVPKPIKRFLEQYPIKILGKAKINKGNAIQIGES